jgi:hypothetical protein
VTTPVLSPAGAPARRPAASSPWRWAAALGTLGAGALHVAAVVEHLSTGDLVVGFFLLTALAQLGAGLWLLLGSWLGIRPGTGPLTAALAGTVLLVCLYLVAHTTDLLAGLTAHGAGHGATGHHAGASVEAEGPVALGDQASTVAEPPGLLGTATVALELLSVLAVTALLPRAWRARTLDSLLVLGAVVWVAWLTGVLG